MDKRSKYLLIGILLVGVILRFWNYFNIPFTYDEFSALFRTRFDNFPDLIEYGVIADTHPALIQVWLYYYIAVFGDNAWVVKLPFVIVGLISIYFSYKIAKKWYNETVALITAAFIATTQFTIMYSIIARPYISGFFFCTMMLWHWTKIIQNPDNKDYKTYGLFILFGTLASYNHHFSLLFAAIIGITGLVLISRKQLILYLLSGALIFVLYIPHLGIFFAQLGKGGIGGPDGWLRAPDGSFLINYIYYIFHFSLVSLALIPIIYLVALFSNSKFVLPWKKLLLSLILFFVPFLIGYFYSTEINPILQFSLLIFNHIFLYFILFSFLPELNFKKNVIIVTSIIGLNIFTLIFSRDHFNGFYSSIYERVLLDAEEVENEFHAEKLIFSEERITQYYFEHWDKQIYSLFSQQFPSFKELKDQLEVKSTQLNHFYYGEEASSNPNELSYVMDYFPYIVWQRNYWGGTSYLLNKDLKNVPARKLVYELNFNQTPPSESTNVDPSKIVTDSLNPSNKCYIMEFGNEYSPGLTVDYQPLLTHRNNFIDVSIDVKTDSLVNGILVLSLQKDDSTYVWYGQDLSSVLREKDLGKWVTLHNVLKVSDTRINVDGLKLNTYFWNQSKSKLMLDNLKIQRREGNPRVYGIFEAM